MKRVRELRHLPKRVRGSPSHAEALEAVFRLVRILAEEAAREDHERSLRRRAKKKERHSK